MNGFTLFILAAVGLIAVLLVLILLRLGAKPTPALDQKDRELEQARRDLADAERRLAGEAEKASRVPVLEREVLDCRKSLDLAREGALDLEVKLATALEAGRRLQESDKNLRLDLDKLGAELKALQARLETQMQAKADLEAQRATLAETLEQERRQAEEKLDLLTKAREEMTNRFKVLAEEVMARHGETFSRQNSEQIDGLLKPLRERMGEFQKALQDAHTETLLDRNTLAEQIRGLVESSAVMSSETQNLTRALKGEAQVQGAWGEMILATILEKSGLREGEEFLTQESHTAEDGTRVRPDVIVNLPAGEKIIIDSKVSLTAFEAYVNAGSEPERAAALIRHLQSIKAHIRELGAKEYHLAAGSRLDYVLMFIPIEGALAVAIQADAELTSVAAECNVAIATPTTLMIALRTVANVWKVERRNKNAEQIASRAGLLYDKFCGLAKDLGEIGRHLGNSRDAYDEAMRKLTEGRGNLVFHVDQLKILGAKTAKTLPASLLADPEGPAEGVETLSEG